MKRILSLLFAFFPLFALAQQNDFNYDWAGFGRYDAANEQLGVKPTVVFMGDSIFDFWVNNQPEYFSDNNFISRGISGQVTSEMLVRFRADVLNLKPKAVVILAGTNDLALNNGFIENEHIVENVASMVDLARKAGIRPILCSVLPAAKYYWRPQVDNVPEKINALNALLKAYAKENKVDWADFHTAMDAGDGSMIKTYHEDEVHPNVAGYTKMQEVLYPYLKKYIKK